MRVLFVCRTNAAFSPMAAALAKSLWRGQVKVKSAGLEPKPLSPYAVRVMKELDLDLSRKKAKAVEDLSSKFCLKVDYIVLLGLRDRPKTLANSRAKVIRWYMPFDIREEFAAPGNLKREKLRRYRMLRDRLRRRLKLFRDAIEPGSAKKRRRSR